MLSYFPLDGLIIKGDDTDMVFKEGTTAFIVESNRIIREVIIVKRTGNLYIVRFANNDGGVRVRGSRLFATREDAEKTGSGEPVSLPSIARLMKRCQKIRFMRT